MLYRIPKGTFCGFQMTKNGKLIFHETTRPFYFDDGDVFERGVICLAFQYGWLQIRTSRFEVSEVDDIETLALLEDVDELLRAVPCEYRNEMDSLHMAYDVAFAHDYTTARAILVSISNRLEFAKDVKILIDNACNGSNSGV